MAEYQSGTGYVDIPSHALYKDPEFLETVMEESRKNQISFRSCMKKCKKGISGSYSRCKDFVNVITRGFHQEIILNNVDADTKNNLVSYIQSLNLNINEDLFDDDGTRVIKVDIGPIVKKEEILNDLLVFIENQKLKMARRNDVMTKRIGGDKDDDKCDTESKSRPSLSSSQEKLQLQSVSICSMVKLKTKPIIESLSFVQRAMAMNDSETIEKIDDLITTPRKKKMFFRKGLSECPIKTNYLVSEESVKHISKETKLIEMNTPSTSNMEYEEKQNCIIETKGDSASKNENKLVDESEKLKINQGVGMFWNSQSLFSNDAKVITENMDSFEIPEIHDSFTSQFSKMESSNLKLNVFKENSTNKLNVQEGSINKCLNEIKIPLIKMKHNEPYMTNGVTSDPSFIGHVSIRNQETNTSTVLIQQQNNIQTVQVGEKVKKKKLKKKIAHFWKRLFKKKKDREAKEIGSRANQSAQMNFQDVEDDENNKINETTNTLLFEELFKVESDAGSKSESYEVMRKNDTSGEQFVSKNNERKNSIFVENCNELFYNKTNMFRNGTAVRSHGTAISSDFPPSTSSSKTRHNKIVNKLYKKLNNFENESDRCISESEISSIDSWQVGRRRMDIRTVHNTYTSSRDSLEISSSQDTVQSVTQTAIKRLADHFCAIKAT